MGLLYVGCYTSDAGREGVGITTYSRDGTRLAKLAELATPAPSYLIADPRRPVLYAVNELPDGAVSSYGREPGGALRALSTRPTGGAHPCHLALCEGHLLAANYTSGSVSVHPVGRDGSLGERTDLVRHEGRGPDPERQEGPHAHQVLPTGGGGVTTVDLGSDRLLHHRFEGGRLKRHGETVLPDGCGPRHAVAGPSGRWYVAAELGCAVVELQPEPGTGALTPVATHPASDAPADRTFPSAIVLSGDGRHLYLGNRGSNTVATFRVAGDGSLRRVGEVPCGGDWPRDIAVAGDALFVANERSHTVVGFRRNPHSGLPEPTGDAIEVGSPACVLPA